MIPLIKAIKGENIQRGWILFIGTVYMHVFVCLSCRWQRLWEPQHFFQLQRDLHQLLWHQTLTCAPTSRLHPLNLKLFPGGITKTCSRPWREDGLQVFSSHRHPPHSSSDPTKKPKLSLCLRMLPVFKLSVDCTHLFWGFAVTRQRNCKWKIAYFHWAVLYSCF